MPTKESLVRRTIIDDPLCDRCHQALENPLHALWLCTELDIVWVVSKLMGFSKNGDVSGLQKAAVMDHYEREKCRALRLHMLVGLDTTKSGPSPLTGLCSSSGTSTLKGTTCRIYIQSGLFNCPGMDCNSSQVPLETSTITRACKN